MRSCEAAKVDDTKRIISALDSRESAAARLFLCLPICLKNESYWKPLISAALGAEWRMRLLKPTPRVPR